MDVLAPNPKSSTLLLLPDSMLICYMPGTARGARTDMAKEPQSSQSCSVGGWDGRGQAARQSMGSGRGRRDPEGEH